MEEMRLELGCMGCWGPVRRQGRAFEMGGIQRGLKVQGETGKGEMDWGSQAGSAQGNLEGEAEAYRGGLWMWRMEPEFPVYL